MVRRAWLLLIVLGLAGCLEGEPTPEPEPVSVPDTPAPVENTTVLPEPVPESQAEPLYIPYTQSDCESAVFIHAVEFSHANSILPLGYTAADLGYLMDLPANTNLAAIGIITYTCQDDDLGLGPHTQAAVSVFIDAPSVSGVQIPRDEVFINVYEFHRFFTHPQQEARYAQAGWSTINNLVGEVTPYVAPPLDLDEHRVPQPAIAGSVGTVDDEPAWEGYLGGGTGFRLKHENLRFWQETPEGVSVVAFTIDKHGRGALSYCDYAPDGIIATTLKIESCDAGSNLGLAVSDFNIEGSIQHFPGVHA